MIAPMFSKDQQRANAVEYLVSMACIRRGLSAAETAAYAKVARDMVADGHTAHKALSAVLRRIKQ
jgi:hypothetical protein